MEKIQRLSAQQRADLAAYLDGELDEAYSQEIERLLARSPVARNDVECLIRTWEMLDLLPREKTTEDFTERTMSAISIDEYREPMTEKAWYQRTRQGVIAAGWIAGLAAAAVLGFSVTSRWIPNEPDQLVQELSLIENMDVYTEVDNIDFILDLERSGLFHEAEPQPKESNDNADRDDNADGDKEADGNQEQAP